MNNLEVIGDFKGDVGRLHLDLNPSLDLAVDDTAEFAKDLARALSLTGHFQSVRVQATTEETNPLLTLNGGW